MCSTTKDIKLEEELMLAVTSIQKDVDCVHMLLNGDIRVEYSCPFLTSDGGRDSHDWHLDLAPSAAKFLIESRKKAVSFIADLEDSVQYAIEEDYSPTIFNYMNGNELLQVAEATQEYSIKYFGHTDSDSTHIESYSAFSDALSDALSRV